MYSLMMCSGRTSMLTLTLRFVVNRMLQSYKLLVSFPVSLVCHTEFLLRHESRLIRLGLDTPSFPFFRLMNLITYARSPAMKNKHTFIVYLKSLPQTVNKRPWLD